MRIWFVIAMLTSFLMGCETTGGASNDARYEERKTAFVTRAKQMREDFDGGPGEARWAILGFTPTGDANIDREQRFSRHNVHDLGGSRRVMELQHEVDGRSGLALYRVGFRPLNFTLTREMIKGEVYGRPWVPLHRPDEITFDEDGWFWTDWHVLKDEVYDGEEFKYYWGADFLFEFGEMNADVRGGNGRETRAITSRLLSGDEALAYVEREGAEARAFLASKDAAKDANKAYGSFQSQWRRNPAYFSDWMREVDCEQPQPAFNRDSSSLNSIRRGRALQKKAECLIDRAEAWDAQPWREAAPDLAETEADLYAKTVDVEREEIPDVEAIYARFDARIEELYDEADSKFADARRYDDLPEDVARRNAEARAASTLRLMQLNAAMNSAFGVTPTAACRPGQVYISNRCVTPTQPSRSSGSTGSAPSRATGGGGSSITLQSGPAPEALANPPPAFVPNQTFAANPFACPETTEALERCAAKDPAWNTKKLCEPEKKAALVSCPFTPKTGGTPGLTLQR